MRPMSLQVITQPASEPVTVAEAKLHCRVDIDDLDASFTGWIAAARAAAETATQRRLITQTVEAKYADWPANGYGFWLPGPPLASVTYVKYYGADGTEQTLSTDVYEVDTASEPGQVVLKPGQSWPTLYGDKANPIRVRYVAGYSDATTMAAALPQVKTGILMCVADWYTTPQNQITGAIASKVPYGAETLFGQCAVPWGY